MTHPPPREHTLPSLLTRAALTLGNAGFAAHYGPASWAGLFFAACAVYWLIRAIDKGVGVYAEWSVDRERAARMTDEEKERTP